MAKSIIRNKPNIQSLKMRRKMLEQQEQITELKQYIDVLKKLIKEKIQKEDTLVN